LLPISYGKENYTVGGVIRVIVELKSEGEKRDFLITLKYLKSELHSLLVSHCYCYTQQPHDGYRQWREIKM